MKTPTRLLSMFISFCLLVGFVISLVPLKQVLPIEHIPNNVPDLSSLLPSNLSFVENFGQTDEAVQFISRGMGGNIFFTKNEVVLSILNAAGEKPEADNSLEFKQRDTLPISQTVVKIQHIGANPDVEIAPVSKIEGFVNYFLGNDKSKWKTNISTYGSIEYQDVYPGITLNYDGQEGTLKGTYSVSSHINPNIIRWKYEGVEVIHIEPSTNDLILTLADGSTLTEKAPVAWQEIHDQQVEVKVLYKLQEDGSVGFDIGQYDKNYSLIIDPTLLYSTYLGGGGEDFGKSISTDNNGNIYVTGSTSSLDFPLSLATQPFGSGGTDIFITRINANGNGLVYSTYFGGGGTDIPTDIAVDSNRNAYISASTNSSNFPTANAYQASFNGLIDSTIIKLNPFGGLVYSTYLGGNSVEFGGHISVDIYGNAYVTGETYSDNFPLINASQSIYREGEAYVTKINSFGNGLIFSTFLGGSAQDYAVDISIDAYGSAYITGVTRSSDFPTPNGYDRSFEGGNCEEVTCSDAFIARLSSTGALQYGTLLGGSNADGGENISIGNDGNIFVSGSTSSANFPVSNAYQSNLGGGRDVFIAKLNINTNQLVYSTYLGGTLDDGAAGIVVDTQGFVYVVGTTDSTNFPILNPIVGQTLGNKDGFITKLNTQGNGLLFSSLLGGNGIEVMAGVAIDTQQVVYIVGYTQSTNFITVNPFQSINRGMADTFIMKVSEPSTYPTQKPVVVIVHGWLGLDENRQFTCKKADGSPNITHYKHEPLTNNDDPDQIRMANWLVQDGYDVWLAHWETGYDRTTSLKDNARCLRDQLAIADDNAPNKKVIVVAHSMGGLVTRAYAEKDLYSKNIQSIFTLGSPHQGVPVNGIGLCRVYALMHPRIKCNTQIGLNEITSGISSFNTHYSSRASNVPYYLVGGNLSWTNASNEGKFLKTFFIHGENDGLVHITSTLVLPNSNARHLTTEGHASVLSRKETYFSPPQGDLYSYSYYECIRPVLQNTPSGCTSNALRPSQIVLPPAQPDFNNYTSMQNGQLLSNQPVEKSVYIDGGQTLFAGNWITGTATFSLINPQGQIIDPAYAASHPSEVSYSRSLVNESPIYASYLVTTTQPGLWKLRLISNNIPSGSTSYQLAAAMNSPITLNANADREWYQQGQNVTLKATFTGNLTSVTVTARIIRPDLSVDTINFLPQGGGQFSATYVAPSAGTYSVQVNASGRNAQSFTVEREVSKSFQAAATTASLNGNYSEMIVDTSNDGRYEALNIMAGITTNLTGTFVLAADLLDSNNNFIAHTSTSLDVSSAGSNTITLHFNGDDILNGGINGPYTLNLILIDNRQELLPIQEVVNAFTTQAYDHTLFGSWKTYVPLINR